MIKWNDFFTLAEKNLRTDPIGSNLYKKNADCQKLNSEV